MLGSTPLPGVLNTSEAILGGIDSLGEEGSDCRIPSPNELGGVCCGMMEITGGAAESALGRGKWGEEEDEEEGEKVAGEEGEGLGYR